MNPVVAVLIFAAFIAAIWWTQQGIDKGVSVAARKLSGQPHRTQSPRGSGLRVTSPAPVDRTLEAAIAAVDAPEAPAAATGSYLKDRGPDWVSFAVGNTRIAPGS